MFHNAFFPRIKDEFAVETAQPSIVSGRYKLEIGHPFRRKEAEKQPRGQSEGYRWKRKTPAAICREGQRKRGALMRKRMPRWTEGVVCRREKHKGQR